jgi:ABC-type glycerol-3-phosphate transport system substrate-binding protein
VNGKLVGLPINLEGPLFYWNKEIFKKCNVAEPMYLEELPEAAAKLKAVLSADELNDLNDGGEVSMDDILAAIDTMNSDYPRHCRAAREIAEAHFDFRHVLPTLLDGILASS